MVTQETQVLGSSSERDGLEFGGSSSSETDVFWSEIRLLLRNRQH